MRLKPKLSISRDNRGVAVIEFAFALPLLLITGLGGLEAANLAVCILRVNQLATSVADNASRVVKAIDEQDINDTMTGALMSATSLSFRSKGRIILSDLQPNDKKTGQWIRWQRCTGDKKVTSDYGEEGGGKNDASIQFMGDPSRPIAAAPGTSLMFVEVKYDYIPLVAGVFGGFAKTISATAARVVRDRPDGDPTNASNLTLTTVC